MIWWENEKKKKKKITPSNRTAFYSCRGTPKGKTTKIDGKIEAYVATPPEGKAKAGHGILYLPDVIGIWQNSQLMADLFAESGYTTVVLDLFNGDPVKLNRPEGFDIMKWLSEGSDGNNPHTPPQVDPIVEAGIKYVKGLGVTKLGAVGYCFGAKVSSHCGRRRRKGITWANACFHALQLVPCPPLQRRHRRRLRGSPVLCRGRRARRHYGTSGHRRS